MIGSEICDPELLEACNDTCNGFLEGWNCINILGSIECSEICGDGFLVGEETCDDGLLDNEGCENDCQGVLDGFVCSVDEPSICCQVEVEIDESIKNC